MKFIYWIAFVAIIIWLQGYNDLKSFYDDIKNTLTGSLQTQESKLSQMLNAQVTQIDPAKLCEVFALGSAFTDLQREKIISELRNKVIIWKLQVYEVSSTPRKNEYRIQTQSCLAKSLMTPIDQLEQEILNAMRNYGGDTTEFITRNIAKNQNVPTFLTVTARNDQEIRHIGSLKTGNWILVRGRIKDESFRHLEIDPAVLMLEQKSDAKFERDKAGNDGKSRNEEDWKIIAKEHLGVDWFLSLQRDLNGDERPELLLKESQDKCESRENIHCKAIFFESRDGKYILRELGAVPGVSIIQNDPEGRAPTRLTRFGWGQCPWPHPRGSGNCGIQISSDGSEIQFSTILAETREYEIINNK